MSTTTEKENALQMLDMLREMIDNYAFDGADITVHAGNNYLPSHGPQWGYVLTGETEVTITVRIHDEEKYARFLKQASVYSMLGESKL